jgi:Protein of unknown function (DUF4239)
MSAFLDAAIVLLVLLGSSVLGFSIRPLLSERHRSREVIDFVQLVVAMLVTFAALVLGLLTSSVKGSFDKVGNQLRGLAIEIIQLDRSLREWGAETEPIRELLRAYTASAIATTWTEEPKPAGDYYPAKVPTNPASRLESSVLEDILARIEHGIRQLEPHDPMHRRLQGTSITQFEALMQTRWRLVEEAGTSISTPFLVILVFWLGVVFASFGLNAPRSLLSYTTIALGAVSVASAIFLILDLDTPFDGIFSVSSEPMRHALTYLGG